MPNAPAALAALMPEPKHATISGLDYHWYEVGKNTKGRAGVPVIRAPYLMLTASAVLVATPAGWRMSEQVMKREFEFAA